MLGETSGLELLAVSQNSRSESKYHVKNKALAQDSAKQKAHIPPSVYRVLGWTDNYSRDEKDLKSLRKLSNSAFSFSQHKNVHSRQLICTLLIHLLFCFVFKLFAAASLQIIYKYVPFSLKAHIN